MKLDYRLLNTDTLRALVEEFVLRDGTDYGEREASLDTKVNHVMRLLEQGKVKLVFDAETESCDLREEGSLSRKVPMPEEKAPHSNEPTEAS